MRLCPRLLDDVYRLQEQAADLEAHERLKMFANLLEGHLRVADPRNRLTFEEYEKVPGRWELFEGMLRG